MSGYFAIAGFSLVLVGMLAQFAGILAGAKVVRATRHRPDSLTYVDLLLNIRWSEKQRKLHRVAEHDGNEFVRRQARTALQLERIFWALFVAGALILLVASAFAGTPKR